LNRAGFAGGWFFVSCAAMVSVSRAAQKFASASAGGRSSMVFALISFRCLRMDFALPK
jgi:hypothetical protein